MGVDFANRFWLDPPGEIMLKPTLNQVEICVDFANCFNWIHPVKSG